MFRISFGKEWNFDSILNYFSTIRWGWCYTFPYITRLLKKENLLVLCYGHDMTLWNVTSNENIMFTNSHACVCPHHKINIFLLLCDLLYPLWFLHSMQSWWKRQWNIFIVSYQFISKMCDMENQNMYSIATNIYSKSAG